MTLVLGTVNRIGLVVAAVAAFSAPALVKSRNPIGVLLCAVAIASPLSFFALKSLFPIGPRYYLFSLLSWLLLVGLWAAEVDRRLGSTWGRLAGITGLVALVTSVGFSAYLYALDGAGERERWRETYEFVRRHSDPDDSVIAGAGRFQAQYYLGREADPLPQTAAEFAALAPGSWVVQRRRGREPPLHDDLLEVEARFDIPSKPWSWVLYVTRVPKP
jgi:hypothetical protein